MSDNSVPTTKIRQLRPRQIRLERLMLFWVLAVLLPAAAIFCLLNYSEFKNLDANKTRTVDLMLETYYKLHRACDYDEYFSNQIRNIEKLAGLPERGSGFIPDQTALNNVSERLFRLFGRLKNHQLLLLIAAGNSLNNTRVFTDTTSSSDYPRPGLRAAREILAEYRRLSIAGRKTGEKQTSNRKILKSFATSIFGTYLNPLDADEDFTSGFSEKSGGGRIFSARRQVLSPDGQPLFSYIALFRETDNPLAHSFALARRQLADSGFSIHLKMQPAIPFPFVFEETEGSIKLTGPVQFNLMVAGFFRGRDLISSLVDRGIMQHKPALYPHFEIRAEHNYFSAHASVVRPGFVIFLFLCLSLLMLRGFHSHGNIQVGIRARLFLSVFLAIALPASIFIFYVHRHVRRDFSRRQNQMNLKLKSHLKQLELSIKSADQAHYANFLDFLNEMRRVACFASEATLKTMIEKDLDKTFSGVGLLRNDGLIVESLDYKKVSVIKLEKKLNMTREFTYASVIRFFQFMGLMPESFLKQLKSSPRGKKLLAIAEIFPPIDIDNFCSYEGQSQTSKHDYGNFRMMNYKILPPPSEAARPGAVLLLIQDIRELAHLLISNLSQSWSFFREKTAEGQIETLIVSCFNLDGTSIDLNHVWPSGRALQQRHMNVIRHLTRFRSEADFIEEEPGGTPVMVVGRKIAGYPLIAVSECRMESISQQKSIIFAVIGGSLAYIFVLLSMLVSILTELFIPSINKLLLATKLTGEGADVSINNSFNNELSHVTTRFNKMSRQVRERERLERFISREAAQTIASESRGNINISSQKVNRSIVFIHIRNFSSLNSSLAPEQLFKLLNQYFPFVEEQINSFGGQIDKYIGDAIMAVFSDQDSTSSAVGACQAVKHIKKNLAAFNNELAGGLLPEIKIGIGISTGEVISGRIGSYQGRLDYTVIGDRVNLAARLETSSHFDSSSHILIDETTWQAAKQFFKCRVHGEIPIKGKNLPVKTYELIV